MLGVSGYSAPLHRVRRDPSPKKHHKGAQDPHAQNVQHLKAGMSGTPPSTPTKPPNVPSIGKQSPAYAASKAAQYQRTDDELFGENEKILLLYTNTYGDSDLHFGNMWNHYKKQYPARSKSFTKTSLKKKWDETLSRNGYTDEQVKRKTKGAPAPSLLPNLTVGPPTPPPSPAPAPSTPIPSFAPGAPAPIVLTPSTPPPAVNPGGQPSAPPAVNPNTNAVILPTTSTSTSTSSSSSSSSNPPPAPPLPKIPQPPAPPTPLPPIGNTTPMNLQNQLLLQKTNLNQTGGGGVGGTGGAGGTVSGGGGGAPGAPLSLNPLVASGAPPQAAPGVVGGGGGVLAPQAPIAPAILKTPLAPFGNVDDKGGDIGSIATLNSQIASLASKPNDVYRPGVNINSEGLIPAIDPYAMTRRDRVHDSVSEFQHIPKTDMGTPKEKMNRGVGETKGNWRYNGPYDHPPGVSNPEYLKLENMVLKNENAARQKGLRQISMWSQTHTKSGTPASRANHFSYNHQKGSWKRMNNNDYRAWMEKRNRRFKEGSEKLAKIKPMTLSEIQSAKRRKMNQDASHGGFISHY